MILLDLFITFFKIGAFTFGGGYAMIALVQAEVLSHGWASQTMVMNIVAISESTPGPLAVNAATYVGMETAGILGSVLATLGVVLPSFVVILIIAKVFDKFKGSKVVRGCMSGLKPAVVSMLATSIVTSVIAVVGNIEELQGTLMGTAAACAAVIFLVTLVMEFKKMHPIAIIAVAAVMGIVCGYAGWIPL